MTREQAMKVGARVLGVDEECVAVSYGVDGHDGSGWYAWHVDYPEDGSVRVDNIEQAA